MRSFSTFFHPGAMLQCWVKYIMKLSTHGGFLVGGTACKAGLEQSAGSVVKHHHTKVDISYNKK